MKVVYFLLPFDLNLEVFVFHISGVRVGQHEVVIFSQCNPLSQITLPNYNIRGLLSIVLENK